MPNKKNVMYKRVCKRCEKSHETATKSSGAICDQCKLQAGMRKPSEDKT